MSNPPITTDSLNEGELYGCDKKPGGSVHTSCNDIIASWAACKPLISRVWLFGSRVRDEHTPESDLDIAVEIDKAAIQGIDYSDGFATWCFVVKEWREELADAVGLKIDLQYYRNGETPKIQAGLDQSSILIYKKPIY